MFTISAAKSQASLEIIFFSEKTEKKLKLFWIFSLNAGVINKMSIGVDI